MSGAKGTLRDSKGNPLFPLSVAEQILVRVDGQQTTLAVLLQDQGLTPLTVVEEEFTLEGTLEPGDLYSVSPYTVGKGRIQIWCDGVYLYGGETGMWQEYGVDGKTSEVVYINEEIPAQSVLTVRVTG